ncbi:hypothetical protein QE152_g29062 [Popillia japonica]|uniref:Uncharacterized protein n=1 Tax=Popillia japonica TaxID=7064 RepID=A0AAW1JJA9_POPJA
MLNAVPIVSDIPDTQTLDKIVKETTRIIHRSAEAAIPYKTLNPFRYNELPDEILRNIHERNRLRKDFQVTRDQQYRLQAKALTTTIRQQIRAHKNVTYNERLRKLNPADGSLWRLNKYLRRERQRINIIQDDNGTIVTDDREIAGKIAEAFESYHRTVDTTPQNLSRVQNVINSFLSQNPADPEQLCKYLAKPRQVKRLITHSPSLKAPGEDVIRNRSPETLTAPRYYLLAGYADQSPVIRINTVIRNRSPETLTAPRYYLLAGTLTSRR